MSATLAEVRKLALELAPQDKLALIGDLSQQLRTQYPPVHKPARRSLHGILAHLGPAPSEEDFKEARREAWKNFPRDADRFDPPPASQVGDGQAPP